MTKRTNEAQKKERNEQSGWMYHEQGQPWNWYIKETHKSQPVKCISSINS